MHCCYCAQLDVSYSVKSETYGWFALKEKSEWSCKIENNNANLTLFFLLL